MDRTLPYYKWFWQDWRANRKIQRMSYIERGLYRELLDECWVEGSIPNDVKELADICNCPVDVMADAWQVLSSCFVFIDGALVNEKLHSLRTEKDIERLKKAENGRKGGISKAIAKQVPSNSHIEEKRREEKIKEDKRKPVDPPDGVSVDLWSDFLVYRKRLKAPVTPRVLERLIKEANLAKMPLDQVLETIIFKGWRSFEASWVAQPTGASAPKNNQEWRTNDNLMIAKANELGLHTVGLQRYEIINKIDATLRSRGI